LNVSTGVLGEPTEGVLGKQLLPGNSGWELRHPELRDLTMNSPAMASW